MIQLRKNIVAFIKIAQTLARILQTVAKQNTGFLNKDLQQN
jgi:hypothetical protein